MTRPELKQFGDLTQEDFDRCPVWIACHTADYDEEWYVDTDEETFRPWTGPMPVAPSDGMFLVKATLTLADHATYVGFVTPAEDVEDLGTMQPQAFVGGTRFGFWGGMLGIPRSGREAFYRAIEKPAQSAFPIRFSADRGLASGVCSGTLSGFYRTPDLMRIEIEI
jgi:hypothetical protein